MPAGAMPGAIGGSTINERIDLTGAVHAIAKSGNLSVVLLLLVAVPYLILVPLAVAIPTTGEPAPGIRALLPMLLLNSLALYVVYPAIFFIVCTWRVPVLSEVIAFSPGMAIGSVIGAAMPTYAEFHFQATARRVQDDWAGFLPDSIGSILIDALIENAAIALALIGGAAIGWPFIRAIWRFRRLRRGLRKHGVVLAFRPWRQSGFRAQMRSLSRWRVAVALSCFFAGVVAIQGIATGIVGVFGTDIVSRGLSVVIAAAIALIAVRGGHIMMRDANRRAMRNLGQVMRGDQRRPVLFLRSFNDDHLQLRARRKPMLWPLVRRRLGAEGSFEEALTIALANFGPVVAIGRPGEAHLPVGAAREYVSDETWKQRVDELIGQAQLIVILIGDTPGLAWEATRLLAPDVRGRVLFVMPPVTDAEAARRWAIMREQIARTGGDPALLPAALDKALVCTLAGDAGGRVFTAIDRAQDHYELAFALAGHEAATGPLPKEAIRLVTGPRAA